MPRSAARRRPRRPCRRTHLDRAVALGRPSREMPPSPLTGPRRTRPRGGCSSRKAVTPPGASTRPDRYSTSRTARGYSRTQAVTKPHQLPMPTRVNAGLIPCGASHLLIAKEHVRPRPETRRRLGRRAIIVDRCRATRMFSSERAYPLDENRRGKSPPSEPWPTRLGCRVGRVQRPVVNCLRAQTRGTDASRPRPMMRSDAARTISNPAYPGRTSPGACGPPTPRPARTSRDTGRSSAHPRRSARRACPARRSARARARRCARPGGSWRGGGR